MPTSTLAGRRIVITRPAADATRLADRLRALGAVPIVAPAIRIEFTDPPELDRALANLGGYHWIVFTSRSGVEAVFRRTGSVAGPKVAAIGPATATTLHARGVEPDLVPAEFVAEAILEALGEVRGLRFLLPRADIAREALAEGLERRGAVVHEIAAYRTTEVSTSRADLGPVDAVTFTSSSTVRGFLAGGPVPDGAKVVCIGPITAQAAREHGLDVAAVAERYTEDGLIAALVAAFGGR
ncbi:MAG: uroporphyrinogen-III synthase [Gemmatimonadetes bacterium]|nr:uroporphyrinogen-III synthase [Gemmatimonadota bacterium]